MNSHRTRTLHKRAMTRILRRAGYTFRDIGHLAGFCAHAAMYWNGHLAKRPNVRLQCDIERP